MGRGSQKVEEQVLVADIGGTNARFALSDIDSPAIGVNSVHCFRAEDYESVFDAAHAYLEIVGATPAKACLAVAGPVGKEIVSFSNSPWMLKPSELGPNLGIPSVKLVNDFYALAAGVGFLTESSLVDVHKGVADPEAPTLVIGPGTGLGQALIVPCGEYRKIVSTEGGHVSFAPRTDDEIQVMKFISKEHPRVSLERLLSGRGLVNIHRALCVQEGSTRANLSSAEIADAAINGTYPVARMAVEMFCSILGRVVGDAVLATGAKGGVILGGGILPKIQDFFLQSAFVERFLDKGRMRGYVEPVPIKLVVEDGAALLGAASILKQATTQ